MSELDLNSHDLHSYNLDDLGQILNRLNIDTLHSNPLVNVIRVDPYNEDMFNDLRWYIELSNGQKYMHFLPMDTDIRGIALLDDDGNTSYKKWRKVYGCTRLSDFLYEDTKLYFYINHRSPRYSTHTEYPRHTEYRIELRNIPAVIKRINDIITEKKLLMRIAVQEIAISMKANDSSKIGITDLKLVPIIVSLNYSDDAVGERKYIKNYAKNFTSRTAFRKAVEERRDILKYD